MKKATFLSRCKKIHKGRGYVYGDLPEDIDLAKDYITYMCPSHGLVKQRAHGHLYGKRCLKCANLQNGQLKAQKAALEFVSKANKKHNNFYKYPYPEDYINNNSMIRIICLIHGEFKQRASCHLSGAGCPECGKEAQQKHNQLKAQKAALEFVSKANKRHNNRYQYPYPEDYIHSQSMIRIICPIHGEFEQTANNHLSGQGCPECGKEIAKKPGQQRAQKAALEFVSKANKRHNNRYQYPYPEDYKTKNSMIRIICPIDGEFKQRARSHLNGRGCPICNYSHGEREVWTLLTEKGLTFVPQHSFTDCRGDCYPLSFDFYIPSLNLLIEYDGEQHFKHVTGWHSKKEFEKQQRYDKIKNEYALSRGIKLLRIRFDESVEEALKFLSKEEVACKV